MTKTKNTQGGKRIGAGAKPLRGERKVGVGIRLTPTLRDYLAELADPAAEPPTSMSETIEVTQRGTKAFRDWLANRKWLAETV